MAKKPSKSETFLKLIEENPNATVEKFEKGVVKISFEDKEWMYNRLARSYTESINGEPQGEVYYMDMEGFYKRYISKVVDYPKNAYKVWNTEEINTLIDMLHNGKSIHEIAAKLERNALAIPARLKIEIDNPDVKFLTIKEADWDKPIIEVIDVSGETQKRQAEEKRRKQVEEAAPLDFSYFEN